ALDEIPPGSVLAFLRSGYSLQFSWPFAAAPEGEVRFLSVALSPLREKLPPSAAVELAHGLSGGPVFIAHGFVVPVGLGRYLATLSRLDDQALLRPDAEGLLLWSRVLPPGEYVLVAQAAAGPDHREPDKPSPAAMVILN